jgi:hypothetical protein
MPVIVEPYALQETLASRKCPPGTPRLRAPLCIRLIPRQDGTNQPVGWLRRERWGPERMARAELYRVFARKCLELAYKVAPESRRVLFEMARIWHQWAQHQEQGAAGREWGAVP